MAKALEIAVLTGVSQNSFDLHFSDDYVLLFPSFSTLNEIQGTEPNDHTFFVPPFLCFLAHFAKEKSVEDAIPYPTFQIQSVIRLMIILGDVIPRGNKQK